VHQQIFVDFSLLRCDIIFPLRKSVTYVNESSGHESCIDCVLVSNAREVLDFEITAPKINFSHHLPLTLIMQGGAYNVDNELNYAILNQSNFNYDGTEVTPCHSISTLITS